MEENVKCEDRPTRLPLIKEALEPLNIHAIKQHNANKSPCDSGIISPFKRLKLLQVSSAGLRDVENISPFKAG